MTAKPIIIVLVAAICAVAVTSSLAQHTNSVSEGSSKTQAPPPLQSPSLTNRTGGSAPPAFNLTTHLETLTKGTNSIDEAGVVSLINALTNRYENLVLDRPEIKYFQSGLWKLAGASYTNDHAYAFLVAAIQPGFWEQHRTWKAKHNEDSCSKMLTGCSVQALASSGRPEAVTLIDALKSMPDISYLAAISGSIVDAHFMIDMLQRHGREGYAALGTEAIVKAYEPWRRTAKGQELWKLYLEVNKAYVEQRRKMQNQW